MYLRNIEGAARSADISRTTAAVTSGRNTSQSIAAARDTASTAATPRSRGAFFDMMLAAQSPAPALPPAPPPAANRSTFQTATARPLSADENSTGARGSSQTAPPKVAAVRNSPATATLPLDATPESTPTGPAPTVPTPTGPAPTVPAPAVPVSDNPVDVINALLTKLGYDASTFQTRVTSSQISYPGASYEYPLLEVTVNGERVGFHLPSAMRDPRITAANISSMMGRPLLNFGVFA